MFNSWNFSEVAHVRGVIIKSAFGFFFTEPFIVTFKILKNFFELVRAIALEEDRSISSEVRNASILPYDLTDLYLGEGMHFEWFALNFARLLLPCLSKPGVWSMRSWQLARLKPLQRSLRDDFLDGFRHRVEKVKYFLELF